MCTLTFVPQKKGGVVTANRDEDPKRNSNALAEHVNAGGQKYLIAKEPIYGGTNIAICQSPSPVITTLLNGAFKPHAFGKKYRLSRGLMLLDSLNDSSLNAFQNRFDFQGIEPFTLVRIGNEIEEIRWDESDLYYVQKPTTEAHIWSSAQLYSPEVISNRERWFAELLSKGSQDAEGLAYFHHHAGTGDSANDLVMNRMNRVKTVSITQSAWSAEKGNAVHHWDMIQDRISEYQFD